MYLCISVGVKAKTRLKSIAVWACKAVLECFRHILHWGQSFLVIILILLWLCNSMKFVTIWKMYTEAKAIAFYNYFKYNCAVGCPRLRPQDHQYCCYIYICTFITSNIMVLYEEERSNSAACDCCWWLYLKKRANDVLILKWKLRVEHNLMNTQCFFSMLPELETDFRLPKCWQVN